MKIAELFGKKPEKSENGSQLNDVLDNIVIIERKRDAAKTELENTLKHLENEQARDIDGDDADIDAAVSGVVSEQARLDSLESLLKQAKARAMALIAAGSASQRKRLTECDQEIADTRAAIDTRMTRAIATFAKKHGLRVAWPTKNVSGVIHLPAMCMEGDELKAIADAVVTAIHVDEDAVNLEALLAERLRLNVLIGSQPDIALEGLLADRRRR